MVKQVKKKTQKELPPVKDDVVVSFSLTFDGFKIIEEVVDDVRKKMRGQQVKFNKRHVYEALMVGGASKFDADSFVIDYINKNQAV